MAEVDEDDFFDVEAAGAPAPSDASPAPVARKPREDPAKRDEIVETGADSPRPERSLDARVLSKKQRALVAAQWNGEARESALDAFVDAQIDVGRRTSGHRGVMAITDASSLLVGIPCPLPFQYLIGQDAMLLGLLYHMLGQKGSCKSAMLYEIMRWFRDAGGMSVLLEVEDKYSADLLTSVAQHRNPRVMLHKCDSVEEWQNKLLKQMAQLQHDMLGTKEKPGPGPTIPVLFGVDSIMGKLSMETQEKIAAAGYGGRSFPIEALSITNYLKSISKEFDDWPFVVVFNNHQKLGKDDSGNEVRRSAGGQGVGFQESFEIEMQVTHKRIECKSWEAVQLRMRCTKNSFAAGHRQIAARMLWWHEPREDGGILQHTFWDWGWSLVELLQSRKGLEAQRLKDAGVHLAAPRVSAIDNAAWSKNLGMTEKDAAPWTVVGNKLMADEVTATKIRQALGIQRRPILTGSYVAQRAALQKDLP